MAVRLQKTKRRNDVRHYRLVHSYPRLAGLSSKSRLYNDVFIGYIGTDSIGSLIKRFAAKKAGVEDGRKSIINVRRSHTLAWSEGPITGRQKTRNCGYDVIVGGELFTDYSDHPRKLVTLNPKLKSTGAGRYQLLSPLVDAYRKQLGLKDSLKSQDAVVLQQIKERGALPMIDRGDIRQAIDRCSNIWGFTAGRCYGRSSIWPTA